MSEIQALRTGPVTALSQSPGKVVALDVLAEGDFFLVLVWTHVTALVALVDMREHHKQGQSLAEDDLESHYTRTGSLNNQGCLRRIIPS